MYGADIRMKSILNYMNISKSFRKTSIQFDVPYSTIHRWYKIYTKYGFDGLKILRTKNKRIRKINDSIKQSILQIINSNPFCTIIEIIKKLNINISISSISKTLRKMKITMKKAINRIEYKGKDLTNERIEFKNKVKHIKNLICLDETGIQYEMRNTIGRSLKGTKIYIKRKSIHYRKQYSCLMVVSPKMKIRHRLYTGSVNKETLTDFINENKSAFRNKTLLLDNVSFHKSKCVLETLEKLNCKVLFTPPYSPYLNPIEEVFSQMKRYIRKSYSYDANYIDLIDDSVKQITKKQISNYYHHAFF